MAVAAGPVVAAAQAEPVMRTTPPRTTRPNARPAAAHASRRSKPARSCSYSVRELTAGRKNGRRRALVKPNAGRTLQHPGQLPFPKMPAWNRTPGANVCPASLGLWSAVAVLVGSTIGSGIFRVPAGVAARLREPGAVLARLGAGRRHRAVRRAHLRRAGRGHARARAACSPTSSRPSVRCPPSSSAGPSSPSSAPPRSAPSPRSSPSTWATSSALARRGPAAWPRRRSCSSALINYVGVSAPPW